MTAERIYGWLTYLGQSLSGGGGGYAYPLLVTIGYRRGNNVYSGFCSVSFHMWFRVFKVLTPHHKNENTPIHSHTRAHTHHTLM